MTSIRRHVALAIRERISRRWGIPFSRYGLDPGIVRFLKGSGPLNFVDVGASEGNVAAAVDAHYGVKQGILIEPQPSRCEQLRQRFPGDRFSVHQCALSDAEEVCDMKVLHWDYSSSILPIRRDLPNMNTVLDLSVRENIEVRVTTLDTLLREIQWQGDIDLLKIDVQGAELMTLRGAQRALARV